MFTYTVNHQPLNPAVPVPYVIASSNWTSTGLRSAAHIVDCEPDSVHIGLPVEVRFESESTGGEIAYVPVFAPRRE